jgi:hypothetical protein
MPSGRWLFCFSFVVRWFAFSLSIASAQVSRSKLGDGFIVFHRSLLQDNRLSISPINREKPGVVYDARARSVRAVETTVYRSQLPARCRIGCDLHGLRGWWCCRVFAPTTDLMNVGQTCQSGTWSLHLQRRRRSASACQDGDNRQVQYGCWSSLCIRIEMFRWDMTSGHRDGYGHGL